MGCKSQKLPINDFKSVDETSEFNEDVTKRYNDENDERYYIDIDV